MYRDAPPPCPHCAEMQREIDRLGAMVRADYQETSDVREDGGLTVVRLGGRTFINQEPPSSIMGWPGLYSASWYTHRGAHVGPFRLMLRRRLNQTVRAHVHNEKRAAMKRLASGLRAVG